MKKYGHTKTLFIQGGKYKWSFKYNYCIECKTCNNKHKGRGLCIKCWDKERDKNTHRKELKRKAGIKWHKNNYIYSDGTKKKGPKPTGFNSKEYCKEWHQKNKEVIRLLGAIYRRRKKGLPCLSMIIDGKIKYFPFEGLDRPEVACDSTGNLTKEMLIYKERLKQFEILKKWYTK